MKNFLFTLLFLLAIPCFMVAQKNTKMAKGLKSLDEVPRLVMPALNNEALLAAELDRRGPGIAPKFAEHLEVNISPATNGTWETAFNGNEVWRMRIHSAGAKSLNLGFTKYYMPPGGTLILYTPKRSEVLGPFTPSDNEEHEQLWTPVVPGDELIIEVQVPASEKENLQLELTSVNHDYVGFAEMSLLSGSCNLDVICSEVDGWAIVDGYRDIIRSVAVISQGGGTFCTGFLVNNANNDCTPFFMTANHCGINSAGDAASLVAYWNFESPVCRQPNSPASGGNGNGQLNDFNTGAIHRASYAPSDFSLVEFDDPVSETANAFFAGWSTEYVMPQDTVICIHHPSTDEKRISFEFQPTQPGNGLNGNVTTIDNADHVIIPDWDIGTTEGGSSGSPLFNNQKQVVGQLHGGAALCGNDAYDSFGWFHTSWTGGGTPNTALRFWLDPNETGIISIDGKDCSYGITVNDSYQELCAPQEAVFTLTPTENFVGNVTLSTSGLPAGAIATFGQNPVAPNTSTTLTITTSGVATGQYSILINATDGVDEGSSTVVISVIAGAPDAVNLTTPNNMATNVTTAPIFNWTDAGGGSTYRIEVATDDAFSNIVQAAEGLSNNSYSSSFLDVLTTYYWRIRSSNICGDGPWSATWSFTTGEINCGIIPASDVPVTIIGDENETVTSTIFISSEVAIAYLILRDLNVSHTWVGDVSATLTSPSGTVVQLFDRPGVSGGGLGCANDNMLVTFDDNATNTATDFENMCEDLPAIEGTFQSIGLLSSFINEPALGNWVLTVVDHVNNDGGAINGWSLDICTIELLDVSMTPSENTFEACTGEQVTFTIALGEDFENSGVNLTVSGNPVGSDVSFSNNPASAGSVVTVTISNITTTGTFNINIIGNDGINNNLTTVMLTTNSTPAAVNLSAPDNMATAVAIAPVFTWTDVGAGSTYRIEVATDDAFSNTVVAEEDLSNTTFSSTFLNVLTTYYWRVRASNNCGEGPWSASWSFTTGENECGILPATDGPMTIIGDENETVTSTIFINSIEEITSIILRDLDISHTYVGDLSATLTSPSGTVVQLFDRPGVPASGFGCANSDLLVSFDDNATNTATDFENTCDDTPAIGGTFQAINPLSAFLGEQTLGNWVLSVTDHANNDGGALHSWSLEICTGEVVDVSMTPSENTFEVCTSEPIIFTITLGEDFGSSGVNLTASGNPAGSAVSFSNNPAPAGSVVTVTISNFTSAGTFNININGSDGINNSFTTVSVTTNSAPFLSNLTSPAINSTGVSLTPTLQWTASALALNYRLEVATDINFLNVFLDQTITATSYLMDLLEYNTTYFWRVTAQNGCGGSPSTIFNFTTEVNVGTDELEGNAFDLLPNPTNGNVNILFAQPMDKELTVEVYGINGQLLQQQFYNQAVSNIPLELNYANGVYVIRLVTAKAAVARRVLLQR
jgi:subtilisin-like proprotein convertase family protein